MNELPDLVNDIRHLMLTKDAAVTLRACDAADLTAIREEWPDLPDAFVDFHKNYGAGTGIDVLAPQIKIELLTTNRLLQAQSAYWTDDAGNDLVEAEEWSSSWVVIAREHAPISDPYVLDLCDPDGPVFHVLRSSALGLRPRRVAANFMGFLMALYVIIEETVIPAVEKVYDRSEESLFPPVADRVAARLRELDPDCEPDGFGASPD